MLTIDHIGVVARDLDESVAFYAKLFGEPIDRTEWTGEQARNVARLMGQPPSLELTAVFFRIPHTNAIFEVLDFNGVDQEEAGGGNVDVGATHMAFYVDDIEETLGRLGVEPSGPPMDLPVGPYRGGRSVYLRDPNGANIQLMQIDRRPGGLALPQDW